jgi:PEP-CTERM motif
MGANKVKTRSVVCFIVLAVALSIGSSAKADTVTVILTGVSGGVQGGVYTSPYYATVGNLKNVPIVCDDYAHEVYMGESWTASISTFADLSQARFWQASGGSQAADQAATLQLYDEAAYLFNELYLQPSQAGDISFALWSIFDPSQVESSAGWDSNAAWWLASAQTQTYTVGEFSNFEVLTPISPTSPQEYLVRTPEPSAALLLGIGLLAMFALSRRKAWRYQPAKQFEF